MKGIAQYGSIVLTDSIARVTEGESIELNGLRLKFSAPGPTATTTNYTTTFDITVGDSKFSILLAPGADVSISSIGNKKQQGKNKPKAVDAVRTKKVPKKAPVQKKVAPVADITDAEFDEFVDSCEPSVVEAPEPILDVVVEEVQASET